jgi:hypothetical protein
MQQFNGGGMKCFGEHYKYIPLVLHVV